MESTSFADEIWRSIEKYEGLYEISSFGRLKRLPKKVVGGNGAVRLYEEAITLGSINGEGYLGCALSKGGRIKSFLIHRLVLAAFKENPANKRTVNHKDECKTNNRLSNLEWATDLENNHHSIEARRKSAGQRGERNAKAKLTKSDVLLIKEYVKKPHNVKAIAAKFGVSSSAIYHIRSGYYWEHAKSDVYADSIPTSSEGFESEDEMIEAINISTNQYSLRLHLN